MRTIIFLLLTLLQFGLMAQQTFTVTARSGLSLRAEPSIDADRIGGMPFNAQVEALYFEDEEPKSETIGDVKGTWVPVRYGQLEGFAFSAYLRSGELFVAGRDGVNEDFRIVVPGMRFEPVNYDADLHWYALTTNFTQEENPDLQLQKVEPTLQIGPEIPVEESGYVDEPNLIYLDAKVPNDHFALLLIGTANPLPQTLDMEQRTFRNCDGSGEMWGQTLFPFQQMPICEADNGSRYSLAGRTVYKPEISQQPVYELSLLKNGYYRINEENVIQSISDELLPENIMFDGEPFRPSFYDHPQLSWSGDLNGDQVPDMLFYQPTDPNACGGAVSYTLLVSEVTSGEIRWHKVSADTMHFEGC